MTNVQCWHKVPFPVSQSWTIFLQLFLHGNKQVESISLFFWLKRWKMKSYLHKILQKRTGYDANWWQHSTLTGIKSNSCHDYSKHYNPSNKQKITDLEIYTKAKLDHNEKRSNKYSVDNSHVNLEKRIKLM